MEEDRRPDSFVEVLARRPERFEPLGCLEDLDGRARPDQVADRPVPDSGVLARDRDDERVFPQISPTRHGGDSGWHPPTPSISIGLMESFKGATGRRSPIWSPGGDGPNDRCNGPIPESSREFAWHNRGATCGRGMNPVGNLMPNFDHLRQPITRLNRCVVRPGPGQMYAIQADRVREQRANIFKAWGVEPTDLAQDRCLERWPRPERRRSWAKQSDRFANDFFHIGFPGGNRSHDDSAIQCRLMQRPVRAIGWKLVGYVQQIFGILEQGEQVGCQCVRCHESPQFCCVATSPTLLRSRPSIGSRWAGWHVSLS